MYEMMGNKMTDENVPKKVDGRKSNLPNGGKGRPPGAYNRTTKDVRDAIAYFAQGNADNFGKWVREVAEGNPECNIKPDPGKAADLYLRACEYHIPKLGRQEVTGANGNPILTMNMESLKGLNDMELMTMEVLLSKSQVQQEVIELDDVSDVDDKASK